jgi:flavin-binding protein dodecin
MPVVKVIEIIGESTKSWEAAAQNAVKTAGKTLRGLVGVDVVSMTAVIKDGKIVKYRTTTKIAFIFEGT